MFSRNHEHKYKMYNFYIFVYHKTLGILAEFEIVNKIFYPKWIQSPQYLHFKFCMFYEI